MKRTVLAIGFILSLCYFPINSGLASVFQALSLKDLTTKADLVFIGACVDVQSAWNPEQTAIYTDSVFEVSEYLKGEAGAYVTVQTIGGVVGEAVLYVPGSPIFKTGERNVVFVRMGKQSGVYHVVGWAQGRFIIREDHDTGREQLRRSLGGMDLVGTSDIVENPIGTLSELKAAVKRTLQENERRGRR